MSDATEGCYRWLTPPSPAAVALLRCPALPALLDRPAPAPGRGRVALLRGVDGAPIDEVVVLSRTVGDWDICTHGGPGVRAAVEAVLAAHGLRPDRQLGATDRWARLARAPSPAACAFLLQDRAAEVPAVFLERQPLLLITGPSNAGKSTLLNAWCGHQRALVSDLPGTTRDLLAAETLCAGWRLRLLDSAGLRAGTDGLEAAGQELLATARRRADCVLYLADEHGGGGPPEPGDLLIHGKADQRAPPWPEPAWAAPAFVGEQRSAALLAGLGRRVLQRLGLPAFDGTADACA